MKPDKCPLDPSQVRDLLQLPNVGPATVADLKNLGYCDPQQLHQQLKSCSPVELSIKLYIQLCEWTQERHDPCVLDLFLSIFDYMDGGGAKVWWHYTPLRRSLTLPDRWR